MDNKNDIDHDESEYPESKWSKIESLEDKFLIEATQRYEEKLKKQESIKTMIQRNQKLLLSLDSNFLVSIFRKFVFSAYLFNISLIFFNLKILRSRGITRFKKFTINSFLFFFGNGLLARYWLYDYPLQQFYSGEVKIQSNQLQSQDEVQNINNKI